MSIAIIIVAVALLTSLQVQVFAQMVPPYGTGPISYNNDDDDLGLLLAILLLAGRNRGSSCGCGCCNCCSSKGSRNIPIPFPIPFPTNNPIINKGSHNCDYEDYEEKPRDKICKGGGTKIYVDISDMNDE